MPIPAHRRPPILPEGYGLGSQDNVRGAIGYMLLSAACFAVMGAMVKAAGDMPTHEKVFFRNLVTLIVTTGMAVRRRENPFGPTDHLPLLLARSFAGLIGVFLYFTALSHLKLADASLLNKISPRCGSASTSRSASQSGSCWPSSAPRWC